MSRGIAADLAAKMISALAVRPMSRLSAIMAAKNAWARAPPLDGAESAPRHGG
jgi:hypothetical protein